MNENNNQSKVLMEVLVFVFLFTSLVGFIGGAVDGHRGCKYESIANFHPAYAFSCELFKPRFKEKE